MRGPCGWASGLELFWGPAHQAPREFLERKRRGGPYQNRRSLREAESSYDRDGAHTKGGLSKAMARFLGATSALQSGDVLDAIWVVLLKQEQREN